MPNRTVVPSHVSGFGRVGREIDGVIRIESVVSVRDIGIEKKGVKGPGRKFWVFESSSMKGLKKGINRVIDLDLIKSIVNIRFGVVVRKSASLTIPRFLKRMKRLSGISHSRNEF